MSLHAKVVFPTPPPTTNALTPQQRIQLVRKTRKIEQIFGTTPYLLDTPAETLGAFHVHFPGQTSARPSKASMAKSRSLSVDSSSDSSSGSPVSIARTLSLSRASTIGPRPKSAGSSERSSRPSTPSSIEFQESWPVNQGKSPVLRLAVQSPLDTIPASPDPTTTTFNMEPIAQALELPQDSSPKPSTTPPTTFFDQVAEDYSSDRATSFLIPSRTSLRKQKLDRLRKKLGCEVPLKLMLPQVGDLDDSDVSPSPLSSPTEMRQQYNPVSYNVLSGENDQHTRPIPRKKQTTGKIVGARDSVADLTVSVKIHRARRASAGSLGFGKKASKKAAKTAEPVPPSPRPVISSPTDFRRVKEKLSLIIESPEEHGTGCSEEFGLSRVSTRSSSSSTYSSPTSSVSYESADAEVKKWSTRKDYEGWRPITPPSEASSTPPTTPSSAKSSQPLLKRPSSYRKPPPPVPADCL
ncbi:hypothetical protein CVT24_012483 [Panaeolus cyanescens]|uniref:Uncharacterized protein n=1 Tax=Panaeolus cyanescens TaxID=181874 RepID=A0A409W659_9AGAR|nr:hypothetical protein CVT24_012483 [Panaeolus cyanescens]